MTIGWTLKSRSPDPDYSKATLVQLECAGTRAQVRLYRTYATVSFSVGADPARDLRAKAIAHQFTADLLETVADLSEDDDVAACDGPAPGVSVHGADGGSRWISVTVTGPARTHMIAAYFGYEETP